MTAGRSAAAVGLALLGGAAACALASLWLAPLHQVGPFNAADFLDYCQGIATFERWDDRIWPHKRSRAAAWLPWALARSRGVVDGLLISSHLGAAAVFAGLGLWAGALAGPRAGAAALLVALTMGPMCTLPRHLGFYPPMDAGLVLGAAAAAAALSRPGLLRLCVAGAGAGLAFLVDLRGLVWGVPYVCAAGLALLRLPPARWPAGALALGAPLFGAWWMGRYAYTRIAQSLESQLDVRPLYARFGATGGIYDPPYEIASRYVWGWTDLRGLPDTVSFLLQQAALPVPAGLQPPNPPEVHAAQVAPWLSVAAVAVPLALLGLRRRPWLALALGATLAPWLVVLQGLSGLAEIQPRFLTQALPGVAVACGVALGPLLDRALARGPGPAALRAALALYLGLLLVVGRVPSPVSPRAPWRSPFWVTTGDLELALAPGIGPPGSAERKALCRDRLVEDARDRGGWPLAEGLAARERRPFPSPPAP